MNNEKKHLGHLQILWQAALLISCFCWIKISAIFSINWQSLNLFCAKYFFIQRFCCFPHCFFFKSAEEKCLAPSAYAIQDKSHRRSLLRLTVSAWNRGTADFLPWQVPEQWEWHQCHRYVLPICCGNKTVSWPDENNIRNTVLCICKSTSTVIFDDSLSFHAYNFFDFSVA